MISDRINTRNRQQWIAEAAYFKAQARGFKPGRALNDWLEAEIDYSEILIATYVAMLEEDGPITMLGLQQLAKLIGIENPEALISELELVHVIQQATKHRPCFRSEVNRFCEETECQWQAECRILISEWYR